MSADIINLRRARKQSARQKKQKQADENRILFGRTRAEKELQQKSQAKAISSLEGHRLESSAPQNKASKDEQ